MPVLPSVLLPSVVVAGVTALLSSFLSMGVGIGVSFLGVTFFMAVVSSLVAFLYSRPVMVDFPLSAALVVALCVDVSLTGVVAIVSLLFALSLPVSMVRSDFFGKRSLPS